MFPLFTSHTRTHHDPAILEKLKGNIPNNENNNANSLTESDITIYYQLDMNDIYTLITKDYSNVRTLDTDWNMNTHLFPYVPNSNSLVAAKHTSKTSNLDAIAIYPSQLFSTYTHHPSRSSQSQYDQLSNSPLYDMAYNCVDIRGNSNPLIYRPYIFGIHRWQPHRVCMLPFYNHLFLHAADKQLQQLINL